MRSLIWILVFVFLISPALAQDKVADAEAAMKRGAYAEAEAAIGEPASPVELYWLGRAQVELKKLEEAEASFRQILDAEPENAGAYEGLARIEIARRNYPGALENANKAVELNRESSEAYYVQGIAFAYTQDFGSSVTSFEKALELDPSHAYAHYNLGLIQNRQRRYDQTIIHFEKFLQLMPNAPEAGQVRSILNTVRR
jgi:tetratricopeptide (TPR) repeat protein